jgi:hypothetical protein
MAAQFSTAVRNAALDAMETAIGTSPTLEIRTGAAPATCATAASGTVLATLALPSDWLAAASSGSKVLAGSWTDAAADATGTAAHFRINQGGTCHMQGTITMSGGGGDMIVDNTSLATGQTFTVTAFTLTMGGA